MKRLPSLKLTVKRVQGRVGTILSRTFVRSTRRAFSLVSSKELNDEGKRRRGKSEVVGQDCKSSRGYYLLVFRKASSRRETRKRWGEKGGGKWEGGGCMQTAVRGGLLIPFIHPSIPRKTERRERDRRLVPRVWRQFVEKGMEIAGRTGHSAGTESVVAVRQCDPELAASRSIPGSLSYPPAPSTLPPPPSFLLPFLHPSSSLLIRAEGGHHKTPRRFPRGSRYTSPDS